MIRLLSAAIAYLFLTLSVWAQGGMMPGPGTPHSAGGGSITMNCAPSGGTAHNDPAGATSTTFTGLGIGSATSGRTNVFLIGFAVGQPITSVVVHNPDIATDPTGVTATNIIHGTDGVNTSSSAWYAANPNNTNTTADVVVSFTSGNFGISIANCVMTGNSASPGTAQKLETGSAAGTTITTPAITIPSNGVGIMGVMGAAPTAFTGGTLDATISGTNATETVGHAGSTGSFTPTATGATTGSPYVFIAVPWGP